jgi:hypothetical protein
MIVAQERIANSTGDRTMFTKMTLAAALILTSGFAALANDRDGEEGGFVIPGSMNGVNPVHHPDWFPSHATQANKGRAAIGSTSPYGKAGEAYGYVGPRVKTAPLRAVTPKEDNYGPEAGKD